MKSWDGLVIMERENEFVRNVVAQALAAKWANGEQFETEPVEDAEDDDVQFESELAALCDYARMAYKFLMVDNSLAAELVLEDERTENAKRRAEKLMQPFPLADKE